ESRWLQVFSLYTDIFEVDFLSVQTIRNTMYLQTDKPGFVQRINHIGCRRIVYPNTQFVANGFDTIMVIFVYFIGSFRFFVKIQRVEPHAAGFVINTPCPSSWCRIHLHLSAIYPTFTVIGFGVDMTTRLNP